MKPRILLVNPPIYDFAAYDFWLKPYGLLEVAGFLRDQAEYTLFDYTDRWHPSVDTRHNAWAQGQFPWTRLPKPACLESVTRYFRRYGLERQLFTDLLKQSPAFDVCLIQGVMTYWYPGVQEVIADMRRLQPGTKIVLGGNYPTICPDHSATLGADLVISGLDLGPVWDLTGLTPDEDQPALWEAYPRLEVGTIKITDGCPFQCTYCSVQKVYGGFRPRPLDRAIKEFDLLRQMGASHMAFYDDALLYQPDAILRPFLDHVRSTRSGMALHSPNALNARFVTRDLAKAMVDAGFKTFFLGFESASSTWQKATGAKVYSEELTQAVAYLAEAGACKKNMTAYQILGHPNADMQELENSMQFVHSQGIRGMLADFSPIPGTPDGDLCAQWVDLSEPLMHNKSAFPALVFGFDAINRLKNLQRALNKTLA
ncbi:MAG: radical SAM protein [Planctomycetes bacterium]|nr:radical SAM protein [Planctomycetota bacterium]